MNGHEGSYSLDAVKIKRTAIAKEHCEHIISHSERYEKERVFEAKVVLNNRLVTVRCKNIQCAWHNKRTGQKNKIKIKSGCDRYAASAMRIWIEHPEQQVCSVFMNSNV